MKSYPYVRPFRNQVNFQNGRTPMKLFYHYHRAPLALEGSIE